MKPVFLLTLFIAAKTVSAQNSSTDSLDYTNALQNSIATYHNALSPENGLYNGKEYVDYAYTLTEGHPYFDEKLTKGTVVYDGMLYENIPMLFDEVKETVVIKGSLFNSLLSLHNERISRFSILYHRFVKLIADTASEPVIKSGFYELLYEGNLVLYKRQTKKLEERINSEGAKKFVIESNNYFIKKGNVFYQVNNKRMLLALLKDRKKEIQQLIKRNNLDFKHYKDDALRQVAAFYDWGNQLKPAAN